MRGRIRLVEADLTDQGRSTGQRLAARWIYNFASQSFMPATWDEAALAGEVAGLGVTRLLESVRRLAPQARFYQSSSSEMFGPRETRKTRRRR